MAYIFGGPEGKESACSAGDPWSGRSPGEGTGHPLQYSCLENPMGRGAWWATVHEVTEKDCDGHTHTREYYSAIKTEVMTFAATWIELEIIRLSELSHTEKDKYDITCMWDLFLKV